MLFIAAPNARDSTCLSGIEEPYLNSLRTKNIMYQKLKVQGDARDDRYEKTVPSKAAASGNDHEVAGRELPLGRPSNVLIIEDSGLQAPTFATAPLNSP